MVEVQSCTKKDQNTQTTFHVLCGEAATADDNVGQSGSVALEKDRVTNIWEKKRPRNRLCWMCDDDTVLEVTRVSITTFHARQV